MRSGTDTLTAARLVGPQGKVFALDMTQAMLAKLRGNATQAEVKNVEVIEGNAETIPLPDASVDVVTSNGVLNLVPDKPRAFAEIHRVLRPAAECRSRTSSYRSRSARAPKPIRSSGQSASSVPWSSRITSVCSEQPVLPM